MIPAEFDYRLATSIADATALLAQAPDAKVLAGGMSLIPVLKHRLLEPGLLIDIGRIAELEAVSERRGRIGLGARVTHATLARGEELADAPILRETAALIGDVQVRNRGTIGGSLVHADPAADWPAVFLALDGEAVVIGTKGKRTIAAGDFFAGVLQSALRPDELLTEVRLELRRKRCGAAYTKLRQPASGFAIVGVAARVETDRKGRCERAAVAITGVNPVPFRARGVESRLLGCELGEESLRQALAEIEELEPMTDIHASAEYRGELARVYAARALARASERARA